MTESDPGRTGGEIPDAGMVGARRQEVGTPVPPDERMSLNLPPKEPDTTPVADTTPVVGAAAESVRETPPAPAAGAAAEKAAPSAGRPAAIAAGAAVLALVVVRLLRRRGKR